MPVKRRSLFNATTGSGEAAAQDHYRDEARN